jgi:hypothetical protein
MRFFNSLTLKISFLAFLGILLPLFAFAYNTFLTDDFETYDYGTLAGQHDWIVSTTANVVSEETYTGSHAAYVVGGSSNILYKNATSEDEGILSFWFYPKDNNDWGFRGDSSIDGQWQFYTKVSNCAANYCDFSYFDGGWQFYNTIHTLTWHFVSIRWHIVGSDFKWTFKLDTGDWQDEMNTQYQAAKYIDRIRFERSAGEFYFDDIGGEITPSFEPRIIGLLPASATEITSPETTLTIKYQNFDWNTYDGFIVNFKDNKIGAVAQSQQFLAEDLNPSGTGQVEINLQNFEIDTNGAWYLTGLAFGTHLDIEAGMYLTTRGYIDFWSDELVETPYYLLINISELPAPYTFTEPNDWYSANSERFATATPFFTSFVGLLSPIFEKVGDFGTRVQNMFDQKEAYDKGFALGEVFPLINGYVQKIDLFFGGFPLVAFFKYLILIMLAIFIVRAVMKFIPFFG